MHTCGSFSLCFGYLLLVSSERYDAAVVLTWRLKSNTNAVRLGSFVIPQVFQKSPAECTLESCFFHRAIESLDKDDFQCSTMFKS